MSHSIKVSVALNMNREIEVLNNMQKEVNDCAKIYKDYFAKEINELSAKILKNKKMLQDLGENIVDSDNTDEIFEYQKTLSTVLKEISNLKSSINYSSIYKKLADEINQSTSTLITKYGIMAILAIEDLKNENIEINHSNLEKRIEENRDKKLDQKRIDSIRIEIQKLIINSPINDTVKSEFINFFDGINTYQEYMDLFAFLETKFSEYSAMEKSIEDIIKALEDIGFKYKSREYFVNEKGVISSKIIAYKDGTKDLTIEISSDRQMEWKFGDYENHMCDADGDKFRKIALPKFGIQTSNWQITRNISNSAPLRKSQAMKARGK